MLKKEEKKPKIIVILGPTASGKSDLAVALALRLSSVQAKKFGITGAEIISADSRQVYKGLDIGTGKITKKEMRGVKHHLIDVAEPSEVFTASDFKDLAEKAIQEILSRKKVPIICGGTGFYIDALFGDKQIPEVPPNLELRKELEQKSTEELFEILKKLDPDRALSIDAKNPRRLIRAIEICEVLGRVPKLVDSSQQLVDRKYEVLKIGVAPLKEITHPLSATLGPSLITREGRKGQKYQIDEEELKERINKRIEKWFEEGFLEEVWNLIKQGISPTRMSEIGLEYRLATQYLLSRAKLSSGENIRLKKLKEEMSLETWAYAKRQITWFKKSKGVEWFTLSNVEGFDPKNIEKIERKVEKFFKN